MSLGKRLFIGGAADDSCTTDTADIFGDNSGVALYSLDYDASDASGNYDGTPSNVTFGEVGQINYAASFNGSSSYISIPSTATTPIDFNSETFSISMWVKFNSLTARDTLISKWDDNSDSVRSFIIRLDQTNSDELQVFEKQSGGSTSYSYTTTGLNLVANTWHHIVFTRSGSEAKIYLDGGSPETFSRTNTINSGGTEPIVLGYRDGQTETLDGSLDQVRFFNTTLSSDNVDTLYAEEACVYTCTTDDNAVGGTNVAYYKFDNNADDEKGSYDGTWSGTEQYEFGRFGAAASFNGSSKITISNSPTLSAVGISMWVNIPNVNGNYTLISKYSADGNDREFMIYNYTTTNGLIFYNYYNGNNGTGAVLTAGDYLTNNTWHHIVFTMNSTTTTKAYIDGVLVATGDSDKLGYNSTSEDIIIGRNAAGTRTLTGKIDQVRIFDFKLDQDDVDALYAEKPCNITLNSNDPFDDSDCIAYYKFDNNADDDLDTHDGTASNVTFDGSDKLFGTHSASFNGGTSSIALSGSTTLTSRSISMWVKPNTLTATSFLFDAMPHNFSANTFGVWGALIGSNGDFVGAAGKWNGSTYAGVYVTDNAIPFNEWTHIVLTSTGSSIKAYYNGVEQNHDNSSFYVQRAIDSVTLSNVRLGDVRTGYATQDTYTLNGRMEQVRIFDRALDGDEIFKLYSEATL